MMPIVSKRRQVDQETGQTVEGKRYLTFHHPHSLTLATDWDLVFADDEREANPTSFKFLQMAHAWRAAQEAQKNGGGGGTPGGPLPGFAPASKPAAAAEPPSPTASSNAGSDE